MIINVRCLMCKRPADDVVTEWNVFRRAWVIDVWCHGEHVELGIAEVALIEKNEFNFEVFKRPVRIIIDRDLGDEDPNEPWRGHTWRM